MPTSHVFKEAGAAAGCDTGQLGRRDPFSSVDAVLERRSLRSTLRSGSVAVEGGAAAGAALMK
jgi:hypothetical protein